MTRVWADKILMGISSAKAVPRWAETESSLPFNARNWGPPSNPYTAPEVWLTWCGLKTLALTVSCVIQPALDFHRALNTRPAPAFNAGANLNLRHRLHHNG